MSAHTLTHVRERLRTAGQETDRRATYTIVSYEFDPALSWSETAIAIQDAASKGWLPVALEWVVGETTVTKLRLLRPAQALLEARGEFVSPIVERNSASIPSAKSISEIASEVREVHARELATSRTSSEQKATALLSDLEIEIDFVLDHYESKARRKRTNKAADVVTKCLTRFSKEQLTAAIDAALVQDKKASCSSIFQSFAGVARLLGIPVPAGARIETWLTPYVHIHTEFIPDGEFQFGEWSRVLRRLEAKHGAAVVQQQFRGYMSETDPSYVSAKRFGLGFGRWRGGAKGSLASTDSPLTVKVL